MTSCTFCVVHSVQTNCCVLRETCPLYGVRVCVCVCVCVRPHVSYQNEFSVPLRQADGLERWQVGHVVVVYVFKYENYKCPPLVAVHALHIHSHVARL